MMPLHTLQQPEHGLRPNSPLQSISLPNTPLQPTHRQERRGLVARSSLLNNTSAHPSSETTMMTSTIATAELSAKTDEALFTEVREQSSEAAFNVLYKRYDKRLYAYCLRATASHDAAKDAFQAVISTVFEKREQFTGGSYAAWLFTIARHHVMKVSKRQQRDLVQNKEIDDEFDALTPAEDSGETSTDRDFLLQESLERAINRLPEDLREAFELKFYDGLQHEEIADLLKISVSLAKVRVFRAKQQLREYLTPIFKELQ